MKIVLREFSFFTFFSLVMSANLSRTMTWSKRLIIAGIGFFSAFLTNQHGLELFLFGAGSDFEKLSVSQNPDSHFFWWNSLIIFLILSVVISPRLS